MADVEKTNILIVDDLQEKILVYQTILESLGENIVIARSGEDALRHVLQRDFAVILLDVHMPGIDGFETASLIRQRKRSALTPIIFLSAFSDEASMAQGYAQGGVDFILTPVVPEILRAKVRVFVDLFRMTQQVQRHADERIALADERNRRQAAEDANRRLGFLSRASAVLGQSLDYESTIRELAQLTVPQLANQAAVARIDGPPSAWEVTLAHWSPEGCNLNRVMGRENLPDALCDAIDQFLAVPNASGILSRHSSSPEPHTIVVPLLVQGQTRAVLALTREPSGRTFARADIDDAEALASRAGAALENAVLYQDVQRADRQKNEFLSMLAHELRNPLAPIRNAVEILRRNAPTQAGVAWARDVIDRQVGHMVRLVDDLLDISRITRGKIRIQMERVNVAEFVAHALEASRPLIEARRHRLSVSMPSGLLCVLGDSARLSQVLTNLLNNAAKYTPEGGYIWFSANCEGNEIVFRVRDTGVGIPIDMLSTVFDLFTQADRSLERSEGGLGIGLTLVKRLIEKHGGTVEALSEGVGRGSEFVVRLALAPSDPLPERDTVAPSAAAPAPRKSRILVVDDNVDGADSLAVLLRLGGHEVSLAHDGPAALDMAHAFKPEVILLDIGLPGMDGFEVAKRLRTREANQETVIVAVTGYGRDEDRNRSREAGFDHHLVKPVSFDALNGVFGLAAQRMQLPPERNAQSAGYGPS